MRRTDHKISVILPVRNGSIPLIKRAISSVLTQTYDDHEILLVDDGSRPDFSKKLDDLAEADRRIRLFHTKPSGVSDARNFAAEMADGDIITYLDGDDALNPLCFEEAVTFFDDDRTDAVWGGTYYTDSPEIERLLKKGDKARTKKELEKLTVRLTQDRLHKTRAEVIGEPFRFGSKGYINRGIAARFIRKSVFDDKKAAFPSGIRMYEDTIWNLEMLDLNIYYVRTIWYYYNNNEKSVSNSYNENVINDIEVPLKRIRKMLDLSNEREYAAYTRFLMDSLRYVYKCMCGNPLWKPDPCTRRRVISHIYNDRPWKEISGSRFFRTACRSDKIKAALFRAKLLFLYWKLSWKKM